MSKKNTTAEEMGNAFEQFSHLVDDGMGGFEAMNAGVVAFPFIRVLQGLSPVCKKNKQEYVEGAEEGMLYNNVNNRLISPPVEVVVGRFDRYYIEWKPERGGFVSAHMPDDVELRLAKNHLRRNASGQIVDPTTNNVFADTYVYYIIFPDFVEDGVCLLSLSSTQLKEARRWNRLLLSTYLPGTNQRAMPYFMRWTITTPPMTNDKGDWAGFKVEFAGFVDKDTLAIVSEERKALPPSTKPDLRALEGGLSDEQAIDVTPDSATAKF